MSRSIEAADGPRSGSLKTCPWSWEQEQKGGQGNQKDQENPGQEESGYFANMRQWASDHPIQATALGAGAAVLVSPAIVASPALGLLGFGANGIVGGSLAAGAQSGIGSVVAPSIFATLQSAGAGGYGVAAVHGVVQGAAAGGLGATGIRGWFKRRGANAKPGDDHEENETADEPNEDGGPESNAPGDGGPQDQADEAGDARPDELQAHL
ncbi:hypothetical protein BGZ61DRAFT_526017 [Ilyonectria robusta]|uniref:uncharacterized protein n=1 Tax=Ilyonectria robusta TaxID=1079257 RepID=UPI001E8DE16A|nr:uncharacterized protein BGZ61DRAFT_526017 [Ilyonectria robusta]KAH8737978.1 hypothetical protein BGZ61DRAFT_526017 [Ilyonectria robusta]